MSFGCRIGPHGYEYFQDCDVVAGLVLLRSENSLLVVIRKEFLPIVDDYIYTVISGCIEDEDEDALDAFLREVREEAGLFFDEFKIHIHDHYIAGHKAVSGSIDLFVIEASDYEYAEPVGDGSYYEQVARTLILPKEAIFSLLRDEHLDLYLGYLLSLSLGMGLFG